MKKKGLMLAALVALVAVLAVGCTSADTKVAATTAADATAEATVGATVAAEVTVAAEATTGTEAGALELTVEELAAYDGKNGNPAYVAVDGVIYDVTDGPQWANGTHNGNTAGKDLTDVIKSAPHGESVLAKLTVVGKLK